MAWKKCGTSLKESFHIDQNQLHQKALYVLCELLNRSKMKGMKEHTWLSWIL